MRRPRRVVFTDEEMLVGGFREPSISASKAWDVALQAQGRVFNRFHILRAVRPDTTGEPMVVNPRREDMAYKTVALASRLMDVAVRYELPALMAEITEELDKTPEND